MNKTYKIQLPRNKEAQNIRTNIKDGTIEVEVELKEKWEPRDGDICFITSHYSFISVFKSQENNDIHTYIDFLVDDNLLVNSVNSNLCSIANIKEFRPATDSEKQLLFDALAKKGKMWDAQKKAVVDLPRWRAERQYIDNQRKWCTYVQSELEFIHEKPQKDIDWEERRYEIARQMLLITSNFTGLACNGISQRRICPEDAVQYAIKYADALIAELKKGGEK